MDGRDHRGWNLGCVQQRSAEPRPFRVSHNVTARAVTTHLLPRAPSRSSPNPASSVRPRVPPSRHPAWLKRTPPVTPCTGTTMGEPDLSNTLYLCSQIRQVLQQTSISGARPACRPPTSSSLRWAARPRCRLQRRRCNVRDWCALFFSDISVKCHLTLCKHSPSVPSASSALTSTKRLSVQHGSTGGLFGVSRPQHELAPRAPRQMRRGKIG